MVLLTFKLTTKVRDTGYDPVWALLAKPCPKTPQIVSDWQRIRSRPSGFIQSNESRNFDSISNHPLKANFITNILAYNITVKAQSIIQSGYMFSVCHFIISFS